MPEGDILRRAALRFGRTLDGHVLTLADLRWPTAAGADLVGRTVVGTRSYGKHLLTRFDDGRTLRTHLRMDGYWRIHPTGEARARAAARNPVVRVLLGTARWTAVGHHVGMLDLVPTDREDDLVGHLGPDVLGDDFPTAGLAEALRRAVDRHAATSVAQVLLDQTVAAGIGTIYMAESLWTRRVHPWAPTGEVADLASVYMTARRLMERSVAARTPTATGDTTPGRTSHVHGRAGEACRRCRALLLEGVVGEPPRERPVFWCPTCQPGGAGTRAAGVSRRA